MADDLSQLQGTWFVSSLKVEGQPMPDSMLAAARIVVKGSRFTSLGMGAEYKGTLKVDESAKPPRFDITFNTGPEKGNTNLGIYKLKDGTWTLCLATRGTVRPKRFASIAGSGIALETLTREKPKLAANIPKTRQPARITAATELEGEWQMVSAVMNGQPMKAADVQWVKRKSIGNKVTIIAGPQTLMRMLFTYDFSATPKTIDYNHTAGSYRGKTQIGIFQLDGNLLTICVGAPDAPRPKAFRSARGDGASLTVWKRIL